MNDLQPGTAYAALIVDGIDGTPFVSATLRSETATGLTLDVPFIDRPASVGARELTQFGHIAQWFDTNTPRVPRNLLVFLQDGPVTLFNCRMLGKSSQLLVGTAFGRISADHAVLAARNGSLADELRICKLRSRVDGLKHWSRLAALRETVRSDTRTFLTERVEIVVESEDKISWRQGDVLVSVQSCWEVSGPVDDRRVRDDVVLLTESDEPLTVDEHLDAQTRVLTLLAILFGGPIAFREHEVSDLRFPSAADDQMFTPFRRLITRTTLRDHESPVFDERKLTNVLATAPRLGPTGMQRWNDRWSQCERVIGPLAGRLRRASGMPEDVVLSASMSLEAAGHLLGKAPNEEATYSGNRPTTATFAFRSLCAVDASLPRASPSRLATARAMANTYNSIKHYNRGPLPDVLHTYLVATLAMQTARAVALFLMIKADEQGVEVNLWESTRDMFIDVENLFELNGVRIEVGGKLTSRS